MEISMNENEKRRSILLEQLRSDSVPVVHPRYRATYNSIYKNDQKKEKKGNIFGIVVMVFFLGIGYYIYVEKPVIDTGTIIERMEQEIERFIDFTNSD